jgi:hypothetical protein
MPGALSQSALKTPNRSAQREDQFQFSSPSSSNNFMKFGVALFFKLGLRKNILRGV